MMTERKNSAYLKKRNCDEAAFGRFRYRAQKCLTVLLAAVSLLALTGCVDQHPDRTAAQEVQQNSAAAAGQENGSEEGRRGSETSPAADGAGADETEELSAAQTLLAVTDPEEKAAVEAAKAKVAGLAESPRIIATSPAAADICDRLELDLVGICSSTVSTLPERYDGLPQVGTAMSPDTEILASLHPDWILSPATLQGDLQPKYEAIGCDWAFLNLSSVQGMYRSIQELGEIFGREAQAQALVEEFSAFYSEYKTRNEGKEAPSVMILMGLPGSYIIATENSYVGSLVELAGGKNVYAGTDKQFLTINTEDMKTKEPDIILRTAHALPDQVIEMFRKDFEENDIWKHFDAVKNGRVYDLDYDHFGMSAKFNYPDALEELQPILYPENEEDLEKARENSDNAGRRAEDSGGAAR